MPLTDVLIALLVGKEPLVFIIFDVEYDFKRALKAFLNALSGLSYINVQKSS